MQYTEIAVPVTQPQTGLEHSSQDWIHAGITTYLLLFSLGHRSRKLTTTRFGTHVSKLVELQENPQFLPHTKYERTQRLVHIFYEDSLSKT
jgi:hypothetical protein